MKIRDESILEESRTLKIKNSTLLIILIVACGLGLRLWFFNGLNWDDDPDYVWRAQQVMTGQGLVYTDNNGLRIGTFAPAALAYAVFGINNFAVGFYALFVSVLSLIVIFKLARLLFDTKTGIIAALLLAFYPLDIELASRLMPDGLLAGFSLFAVYVLFKGEMKNRASEKPKLEAPLLYVVSGVLLGWCTVVNMSSLVLFIFLAAYFLFSIFVFKGKMKKIGWLKGLLKIWAPRAILLIGGFALVVSVEGILYAHKTGQFFFKYKTTAAHFGENHGFNLDLSTYPRSMFHVNTKGKFQFQGRENSYYGFYWIFVFFALIYGLTQRKGNAYFVIIWLLAVWLYMQWGSMSLSRYIPMHRLPRHLALATPAMILVLAYFLGSFRPIEIRKYLTPAVLVFCAGSSLYLSYFRHQSLEDSVAPQPVIQASLPFLKPKHIYAANNTIAYQKFFDRFKTRDWEYRDILEAPTNRFPDAYAIIGEHRNWADMSRVIWPDLARPQENWEQVANVKAPGKLNRPPFELKFYRLLTASIPELKFRDYQKMRDFLTTKFPEQFGPKSELIMSWAGAQVDGMDEVTLKRDQLTLTHVVFNEPKDINYQIFKPLPPLASRDYRIIREQGRGEVSIVDWPAAINDFALKIRIDDGPYPSFDYYRFFLVAGPKGR